MHSTQFFKIKSFKIFSMFKYNEKGLFMNKTTRDDYNSSSRRPFETLTSAFYSIFKTKSSSILLMLESKLINVFCHVEADH